MKQSSSYLLEKLIAQMGQVHPGSPLNILHEYVESRFQSLMECMQGASRYHEYILCKSIGFEAIATEGIIVEVAADAVASIENKHNVVLHSVGDDRYEVLLPHNDIDVRVELIPMECIALGTESIHSVESVEIVYGDGVRKALTESDYLLLKEDAKMFLLNPISHRQNYYSGFSIRVSGIKVFAKSLPFKSKYNQDFVKGESIEEFLNRFRSVLSIIKSLNINEKSNIAETAASSPSAEWKNHFMETIIARRQQSIKRSFAFKMGDYVLDEDSAVLKPYCEDLEDIYHIVEVERNKSGEGSGIRE